MEEREGWNLRFHQFNFLHPFLVIISINHSEDILDFQVYARSRLSDTKFTGSDT